MSATRKICAPSLRATLDMLANVEFPYQVNELLSPAAESRGAHILRVADIYDSLRRIHTGAEEEDLLFDQIRQLPTGTIDSEVLETFIHLRKQERVISAMNIFWSDI